jgi:protein phosphatase
MLVCPQCQFENPDTNKFCQECGTSLTQNVCPECGSLVPFQSVHCQVCDTVAGIIWWAIRLENQPALAADIEAAGDDSGVTDYLDAQQRYQVLQLLPRADRSEEEQLRVLDCRPLQPSLLEVLVEKGIPTLSLEGKAVDLEDEYEESEFTRLLTIPPIAKPYLALRSQFYQALPAIRDAWQQDQQQVLVLEDRAHLPLLLDLWSREDLPPPSLQILHWLYEMVELWEALESHGCSQSLLELTNLRVDEDQAFCLQRLYSNPIGAAPTLQNLGDTWQILFSQSQRTQLNKLSLLLSELQDGRIITIPSLRARIEAIAYELQMVQSPPAPISDLDTAPNQNGRSQVDSSRSPHPIAPHPQGVAFSSPSLEEQDLPLDDDLEMDSSEMDSEEGDDGDDERTIVLPMQLFSLDDVGRSDVGRQRPHNEDYFGIDTQVMKLESPTGRTIHVRNLYILCDGMGGQADGEIASALAVDTLRHYFKSQWQNTPFAETYNSLPGPEVLIEAVQLANKAIFDINQQNARSGSGRMGTTLVMALVQDTEVAIAHVGDSRLYRYTRKRGLEQLTVDHEVGQREIQRGATPEVAYARPDAYQLTQALGPRDENFVKPDVQYLELNEDTLLFLCSDGLTDNDLLETHYRTHIEPLLSSQANLDQGVSQLIDLANRYNGHDNITAIAIRAKVRPDLAHLR